MGSFTTIIYETTPYCRKCFNKINDFETMKLLQNIAQVLVRFSSLWGSIYWVFILLHFKRQEDISVRISDTHFSSSAIETISRYFLWTSSCLPYFGLTSPLHNSWASIYYTWKCFGFLYNILKFKPYSLWIRAYSERTLVIYTLQWYNNLINIWNGLYI